MTLTGSKGREWKRVEAEGKMRGKERGVEREVGKAEKEYEQESVRGDELGMETFFSGSRMRVAS